MLNTKDKRFQNMEQTETLPKYSHSTINAHRKILGAFMPKSELELIEIVKDSQKNNRKLYTISTGNNWGYGSALPVREPSHILDLSAMDKILFFDPKRGVITVEPGVTQGQLYEFLKKSDYMPPTTGAGAEASILGNLLERGYGLNPIQDHISSLISLRAILADGTIYESSFKGIAPNSQFRWGIGPYLDGIFTQSNMGVVSHLTFQLAKRPKHVLLIKATFKNESLPKIVETCSNLIESYPGILSGINLMNKERITSMNIKNAPDWTMACSLISEKKINKYVKGQIRRELRKCGTTLLAIDEKNANLLAKLPLPTAIKENLNTAKEFMNIMNGIPTRLALNLCYSKESTTKTFNPAKDNIGLLWYSPIVPMESDKVDKYVQMVRKIAFKHGFEPLITLTSLSHNVFDSTVPIVFRRDDGADETEKAKSFYKALLESGFEKGFFPYRMGIEHMEYLTEKNEPFFDIAEKIKKVLDPTGILSPGRYSKS